MTLNPPYTGDPDLDSYLYNIYLDVTQLKEVTAPADINTGIITDDNNNITGFLYRYLNIKYADDSSGTNISDVPTGKLYFGVFNSNQVIESSNPADYTWIQVSGTFGSNKYLWLLNTGGRQVSFFVGETPPDEALWKLAPVRSVDLDKPTTEFKKYMSIRYATATDGTGFSTSPVNKNFYGVYTSDTEAASTDPLDYEWSPFDFGTTYELYYRSYGGRSIDIEAYTERPIGLILYKDASIINLDVVTFAPVNSIGIVEEEPLSVVSPLRYLLIKFADSSTGTGLSNDPTGKTYFGLQSSDVVYEDNSPDNYTWFAAGAPLVTTVKLWYRSIGNNIISFSLSADAPDTTGWYDAADFNSVSHYIDTYGRSGTVVTNLTSPTDGRIGYTQTSTGIYNINLDPYGQGSNSGGFSFDPASTSTISVDQYGRLISAAPLDQVRYSLGMTSASAGQTVFTFSNAQPDQVLFFKNGVYLQPGTDYTRTSTTLTLTNACTAGDSMAAYYIRLIDAVTSADKVPFTTSTQTLSNVSTVSHSSVDGSELLFLNGVLIVDSDYTYLPAGAGYQFNNSVSGNLTIVTFVKNNSNVLIFNENYAEKQTGTNVITYPTPFQRNSSLNWFNGVLLKPSTDYTIPGATDLIYNYILTAPLSYSGQPSQFCSFNSAGPASVGSLSSAGVLGYDVPIEIQREPSIKDLFLQLQAQVEVLTNEINYLKGNL